MERLRSLAARVVRSGQDATSVGHGILFALLLASPLTFSLATAEAFELPKLGVLTLTALALAATCGPAWRWRLPRDGVSIGVLFFFASAAVSTALSPAPVTSLLGAHESFAGLVTVAGYTVVYFAARALCPTPRHVRRLLVASVVAGGIAALYALAQALGRDPLRWERVARWGEYVRPFATFGHANFLSAFLVMVFPFAFVFARRAAEEARLVAAGAFGAVALLCAVVIVLCLSRGSWLAFAAVWIVFAVGHLAVRGRRSLVAWGWGLAASLATGGLLALVLPGSWVNRLFERATHVARDPARLEIWKAGLRMFREQPLTGVGLDVFPYAFGRQRTAAYWLLEGNGTPAKAHNEAIHVLATQGALGGAALILLTVGLVRAGRRAWRCGAAEDRPLLLAVYAAVLACYVQALFGFVVIGCGALFVVLAGVLSGWGRSPAANTVGPARPLLLPSLGLAAVVLAYLGVVRPLQASAACRRGTTIAGQLAGLPPAVAAQQATVALAEHERSVALDPARELHWVRLGVTAQAAARHAPDLAWRRQRLRWAAEAFRHAIWLNPVNAYNHANLARVLAALVDEGRARPDEVWASWDAALALEPNNVAFLAEAAALAGTAGDPARARRWRAKAEALRAAAARP